MMSKIIQSIIIFFIQIITALIIYEVGINFYKIFNTVRNNLNWGITLTFASYLYLILALLCSMIYIFVNKKYRTIIIIFIYIIYTLLFISNWSYTPYRLFSIYISTLIGTSTIFLFPYALKLFNKIKVV